MNLSRIAAQLQSVFGFVSARKSSDGAVNGIIVSGRDVDHIFGGTHIFNEVSAGARTRKSIYSAIESGGRIGCLGDSTVAPWIGYGIGYGFSGALRRAIGSCSVAANINHEGVVAPVAGNNSTAGVWSVAGKYVFSSLASPLVAGISATANPSQVGTAVRVYYLNTGGQSTVSVDGGAADPMPRNGSNTVAVFEKTGLVCGKHTLNFNLTSGTDFHIFGVETYNPGDLPIINFGAGGAKSSDIYQPAMWYSSLNLIKQLAPKVCFIRCGTNDILQGIGHETTVANIVGIAQSLSASNTLAVLLPIVPISGKDTERTLLWEAIKSSAETAGYLYADYGDYCWGRTYPEANGYGVMRDTVHLNANGQLRESAALRRWLSM